MQEGIAHKIPRNQVFHSLDFKDEFYMVKSGYVKRSSIRRIDSRSVQAIYGPGYFFPLTPMFKLYLNLHLSPTDTSYFYEAITDVEVYTLSSKQLLAALENDKTVAVDLLYESGRRLKSNIHSLENNVWKDGTKRLAHHLVYLSEEFGKDESTGSRLEIRSRILVPLTAVDLSEQLDISEKEVNTDIAVLTKRNLISMDGDSVVILNVDMLKDVYLEK
jgi:CRP-like cAMP-binding protein